jgi:hypothetical protein
MSIPSHRITAAGSGCSGIILADFIGQSSLLHSHGAGMFQEVKRCGNNNLDSH